tara:strand:- start:570 stop:911 length:342 start_codon:yes stop_codon:yes gene_type:complete
MSIFINNEAKENFKAFWFGLAIPILGGVAISTVSLIVLMSSGLHFEQFTLIHHLIIIFVMSGHLVIWPLLAWWLLRRANKLQNLHRRRGASMSIKLYIIWVTCIVVAGLLDSA